MDEVAQHSLYVMAADQAPRLNLTARQCLVVAAKPDLKVGDSLYFRSLERSLTIQKLTLVLGKLLSVDATEHGHRYVVEFDQEDLPNDVTESYAFELA